MNLMFSIICSNVGYALNSCCCFHLDGDDEDDEDDNDDDMKCCSQTMNVKKSSLIHKNFMVFGKSKKKKKNHNIHVKVGRKTIDDVKGYISKPNCS